MSVSMALSERSRNVSVDGMFLFLLLAILLALGGCGGGGSSDQPPLGPTTWTVSATAGAGGSIDPARHTVHHGATATFTVTPEPGYSIAAVSGCGGSLVGSTYTTGIITGACTVSATFSVSLSAPQKLQATAGNGEALLQWTDVDGADGYTIYHATAGGIQPPNFGIWESQHNGVAIRDVTSPRTVEALTNGTQYFFVVTAIAGRQESGPSSEVSAVPRELPVVTDRINDTGIDWCADGSNNHLACPVAGYPGQDGDFGRDAAARAGTLQKVGAGAAGFDFTKIGNNGLALPASATLGGSPSDWSCTRDNVTGLIWEVKTTDGGLRDRNHTYTWYQPDGPNMGAPGTQDGGSCVGSACDTSGFVQAVNAQGLCGAADWRVPTVGELLSILHHGLEPGPGEASVDRKFFPNTPIADFWSASPFAGNSDQAWSAPSIGGRSYWWGKSSRLAVRLVRGGSDIPSSANGCVADLMETTPTSEFTFLEGGAVVRHERTGLEWRRCAEGLSWTGTECSGWLPMGFTWQGALQHADATSGWRLPSINELRSIVERCRVLPAFNQQVFPDTRWAWYWSASPDLFARDSAFAWGIDGDNGSDLWIGKGSSSVYIRLVRDGQ